MVLEVNDTPALGQHLPPLSDPSRPVGEAIVDLLFPRPQTGRIPVVAVAGGRRAGSVSDRRPVTRLVTHILRGTGWRVGMASADGLYLDGRRVRAGDGTGLRGAWAVLRNPTMEAAVLETSWGAILREGLGFDHCDVAVVTDTGEGDHLGPQALEAPTGLAGARRVLVEAVAPQGAAVLKADDPLVETLAAHCPGSVVLFARDPDHPVLAAHREASGRAVFARHDELVLAEGPREVVLVRLVGVPLGVSATGGCGGHTSSELENALAAVAATWVLGCPLQAIRAGLETFAADIVPGRAM